MKLSAHQRYALDSARNWAVCTGAGAGKTTLLTERYLHLLETHPDLNIEQILALTFTQKAAEEMKGRIYRALQERGKASPRFQAIKEQFQENRVSTFHAFCLNLLRAYPVEAQVDAEFSVLREFEREHLLGEIYQDVLLRFVRKPESGELSDDNRLILKLLEAFEPRDLRGKTLFLLSKQPQYREFLQLFKKAADDPQKFIGKIQTQWAATVKDALDIADLLPRVQALVKALVEQAHEVPAFLHEIIAGLEKADDLRAFGDLSTSIRDWLDGDVFRRPKPAKMPITWVQLRERLKKSGIETMDADLERVGLEYLELLIVFVNEVHLAFEGELHRRNLMDFDGIQFKTRELLKSHLHVRTAMRQQFRFLLIDEFQDTDPLQWEILRLLGSTEAGDLYPDRIFIVGDDKQAIYGFRGGDVRVFSEAQRQIRQANRIAPPLVDNDPDMADINLGDLHLHENYRSHAVPIAFLNAFFRKLFSPERMWDPKPQDLVCKKDAAGPGSVRILAVPKEINGDEEADDEPAVWTTARVREAFFLGGWLRRVLDLQNTEFQGVHRAIQERRVGVGVLFRRFTEIKLYEDALRQQGLEFLVHRGKGFFKRQEVLDLFNVLEFLNDPRRDINLVGLLRSPVFALSDSEIFALKSQSAATSLFRRLREHENLAYQSIYRQLQAWLQLKDRLRISELLRRIIGDVGWNAVFALGPRGSQTLHNVEKFIDMARQYEQSGIRGLAEFCEYTRLQIDEDEKEGEAALDFGVSPPIVLMTIHQAKGLEFPMVVLPDLNAKFNIGQGGDVFEILDGENGYFFGIQAPNPKRRFAKEPTMAKRLLLERHKTRMIAEQKRLLYVGMTRAMEHLVLMGQGREFAANHQAKPVNEARSAWEWLETILGVARGVSSVQIAGEAGEYPVIWDEAFKAPSVDIGAVNVPAPAAQMPKEGYFDIQTAPVTSRQTLEITPTALSIFSDCARKYYFSEVLRIPENFALLNLRSLRDDQDPLQSVEGSRASLRGSLVHHFMEKWPALKAGEAWTGQVEPLARVLLQNQSPWIRTQVDPAALCRDVTSDVAGALKDPWLHEALSAPEVFSELPFEVNVGDMVLKGQIDKLIALPDAKSWMVLDFKTNRMRKKSDHASMLRAIVDEHHYDLQLNCYALAAEQILGYDSVRRLTLYFTALSGEGSAHFEMTKNLGEVERQLAALKERFGGGEVPSVQDLGAPRHDGLCKACAYRVQGICEYGKRVVA